MVCVAAWQTLARGQCRCPKCTQRFDHLCASRILYRRDGALG